MNTTDILFSKKLNLLYKFLLVFIIIISCGCEEDNPFLESLEDYSRGDLTEATMLKTFSTEEISAALALIDISIPYEIQYRVEYINIKYQTVDYNNNLVVASGGYFLPVYSNNISLLSLQHGTEVKRENVASTSPMNSVEGMTGLMIASLGYATAVPDYIGFGVSQLSHPYIHAKSLSVSVIDFLRAVKIYNTQNGNILNNKLFLSGYSEGGFATLATQKEIEENYQNEFTITAVAPLAGPYDLTGTTLEIFNLKSHPVPTYIAYLFTAYNEIYNWNKLTQIFNSPYSERVADLFDGTYSWNEIENQLPSTLSGLIKDEFITSYLSGKEPEVSLAIKENTLLHWSPISPIAFIHGTADKVVPYQNSVIAYENLSQRSSTTIDLIPINGGTHESSGLPAILKMLEFFENYAGTDLLFSREFDKQL